MKTFNTWLLAFLSLQRLAISDPAKPAEEKEPATPNEVSDKEVKMPGVTVNRETHEIRIEAAVCLQQGILEYVVCKPGTFEHEAIFTTTAKPELIHAALLLSGIKPTPLPRNSPVLWWGRALKQKASRVKIEVEWKEGKATKRINLIKMLQSREDIDEEDAPAKKVQDAWVFAGSFLHQNEKSKKPIYAANLSGIIVGIWPDPSTVIQYGIENGNPYEGKRLGIEINEKLVPKVGTKVDLVFSKFEAALKKNEE
jgi:hypothetical protein